MAHVKRSLKPSPQFRIGASIGMSGGQFSIPKCDCWSLPIGHFIPYSTLWQQTSGPWLIPGMGSLRNVALETLPSFPSPMRKNGDSKVSNLVPISLEPSGLQFSEVVGLSQHLRYFLSSFWSLQEDTLTFQRYMWTGRRQPKSSQRMSHWASLHSCFLRPQCFGVFWILAYTLAMPILFS